MDIDYSNLLNQERFKPPENWDWSYRTINGIKIRYGQARSRKIYRAVVVMFEGFGDFGEQYFELARDLDAHDLKLLIIDLPGQGGSGRYLKNPQKRHSVGFDSVLSDLHGIIDEIALSAAIDPDDNHKRLPIILLAHSMGGNLAIRYLAEYNKSSRGLPIFSCVAMTAPMFGILAIEKLNPILSTVALPLLSLFPNAYIPFGGDWEREQKTRKYASYKLTSDVERGNLQNAFFSDPQYKHLITGSPTIKWLMDAQASCNTIKTAGYLEKINIPVLIGLAEKDDLVSNNAIRAAVKRLPNAQLIEFPTAYHEILMETDDIRGRFLDHFFTFINENVLMKPDNGKIYIQ